MLDITISCAPDQAATLIEESLTDSGISTKLIDKHSVLTGYDRQVIVLVFEKYFMRNSSRASLTVAIENLNNSCNVHAVSSGGGQGAIFSFDWGAGDNLESYVGRALEQYEL